MAAPTEELIRSFGSIEGIAIAKVEALRNLAKTLQKLGLLPQGGNTPIVDRFTACLRAFRSFLEKNSVGAELKNLGEQLVALEELLDLKRCIEYPNKDLMDARRFAKTAFDICRSCQGGFSSETKAKLTFILEDISGMLQGKTPVAGHNREIGVGAPIDPEQRLLSTLAKIEELEREKAHLAEQIAANERNAGLIEQQLRAELGDREARIEQLQRDKVQLEQEKAQFEKDKAQLESDKKTAIELQRATHAECNRLREKLRSKEANYKKAEDARLAVESELDIAKREVIALESQLQIAEREVIAARVAVEKTNKQLEVVRGQLTQVQRSLELVASERDAALTENRELRVERDAAKREAEALQLQLQAAEERAATAKLAFEKADRQFAGVKEQLVQAQKDLEIAIHERDVAVNESDELRAEVVALQSRLQIVEQQASEARLVLKRTNEQCVAVREQLEQTQSALAIITGEHDEALAQRDSAIAQKDQALTKNRSLRAELDAAIEDRKASEERKMAAEVARTAALTESRALRVELEATEAECKNNREAKITAERERDAARGELDLAKLQVNDLGARLLAAQRELKELSEARERDRKSAEEVRIVLITERDAARHAQGNAEGQRDLAFEERDLARAEVARIQEESSLYRRFWDRAHKGPR